MKFTEKKKIAIMAILTGAVLGNIVLLNYIYGDIDLKDVLDEGGSSRYFIDSLGREVKVPKHPDRIVSMTPAITEILYAIDADDRLYGVTNYCNYPEDTDTKTKIGGFSSPNLEIIVSLEPDLVISSRNDLEVIDTLESYDIAIVIIKAEDLDEILKNIEDIGFLVNEEKNSEELTEEMKEKMDFITDRTKVIANKEKCYFEVWETPKVAGKYSFIDDMIKKAGGINIFGDINEEFPIVSHESVISIRNIVVVAIF